MPGPHHDADVAGAGAARGRRSAAAGRAGASRPRLQARRVARRALLVGAVLHRRVRASASAHGQPGRCAGTPDGPEAARRPAAALPAPQLHLPITARGNRRYVLWSTRGLPRDRERSRQLRSKRARAPRSRDVERFPDAGSRGASARARRADRGLPSSSGRWHLWQGAERRPIAGLGRSGAGARSCALGLCDHRAAMSASRRRTSATAALEARRAGEHLPARAVLGAPSRRRGGVQHDADGQGRPQR